MINVKKIKREFVAEISDKNIDSILDLGCGKNPVSLLFSLDNKKVIGIDKEKFEIKSENFEFINKRISNKDFDKSYDLIIASLLLHCFKKEIIPFFITDIKNATRKKGYNFLICLSNEDDSSNNKENFYPSLSNLKRFYTDWKIIKITQGTTEIENHDNLGNHQHDIIFLLVQKIS